MTFESVRREIYFENRLATNQASSDIKAKVFPLLIVLAPTGQSETFHDFVKLPDVVIDVSVTIFGIEFTGELARLCRETHCLPPRHVSEPIASGQLDNILSIS